jgi:hypothetical protein
MDKARIHQYWSSNQNNLDEDDQLTCELKNLLMDYTYCYGSNSDKIQFLMDNSPALYAEYISRRNDILKLNNTRPTK